MKIMHDSLIIKQHRRNFFNMKKKLRKLKKLPPSLIYSARKELLRASKKRNRRKTPYPFGFEYAKERR